MSERIVTIGGMEATRPFSALIEGYTTQLNHTTRAPADILAGSQIALFTVSGGRVLLLGLIGEVSVAAVDASASNMSFVSNPTVGTDMAMCAVREINADEEGSLYSITGTVGDAVVGGSGGGAQMMGNGLIIPEGTIDVLTVADVGTGGALMGVDIWWFALDTGAAVVAT